MSSFQPWQVVNLELSDGIPTLALAPAYQGLYLVLWWHQIPLGHLVIAAPQLPMPAAQLATQILQTITPAVGCHLLAHGFKANLPTLSANPARDRPADFEALMALAQPLAQLQHRWSSPPPATTVSVIVCTRDRPAQLAKCLQALQALKQPPHEILVVDNAPSSDATRELVAAMPQIRYLREPRPGLSAARNTGIRQTTGELIAFTDDDVQVHPDWVVRLQQGFQDPRVMAVTGLVLPSELETETQFQFQVGSGGPGWKYQALIFDQLFFAEMCARGVPVWRIGAGANMAFRRKTFDLLGVFDERLGAGASGCSEDSELWYRVLAAGWVCRYEPTAVVFHSHRADLASLKQQMYQYLRGHVVALLVQFARHRHWGNLRRLFLAMPKYYGGLFLRGLRRGFRQPYSTVLAEIQGYCAGYGYYLRHRVPSEPPESKVP